MTTYVHFGSHLAQFFLEWEKIQTKFVEKTNTHFYFQKIIRYYRFKA